MTDKQIKQNAEEYAEQNKVNFSKNKNFEVYDYFEQKEAYIAGAHSRDEEIEMLQNQIEELSEQLKMNAENIQKLRNPWISIEEGLPKCKWDERVSKNHSDDCLVLQADGSRCVAQYYCDFEAWSDTNYICEWIRNITHWMPIPKLKGGK